MAVTDVIRRAYERRPYPVSDRRVASARFAHLPPLDWVQAIGRPGAPALRRVLVAGCGTGFMASCLAKLFADGAEITGIDLSRASLSYAARQARSLGLSIDYGQADILALPAALGQFDIIECGGVLHHTGDVMRSWLLLCGHLKPGGLMKIALYNRNGRDWVHAPRRLAQTGGYKTTAKDMRRFRRDLMRAATQPSALPNGLHKILTYLDFYSLSMCRDACFHVQEAEYSLREITVMSDSLDLHFLGLSFDHEAIYENYQRSFPQDRYASDVRLIELFEKENREAGGSMYTLLFQKPGEQAA